MSLEKKAYILKTCRLRLIPTFIITIFTGLVLHGCNVIKAIGKNPSGETLKSIETIQNYKNGQFQNLYPGYQPDTVISFSKKPQLLRLIKFLKGQPKELLPTKPLIAWKTDLKNTSYNKPTVIWFGHSSFLVKAGKANILFDPSFSGFAGPFRGAIKAFKGSNNYDERDMPVIDALVISHDHYDHLDYITVKRMRKKIKRIIVPIGVGSHFRYWGFPADMITELNWNDSVKLSDSITITATPAHHRSNRTLEQKKTLWASYVIRAGSFKIFYSGDSGYSQHFKRIGQQFGPFDLAMMECGQYNLKWPQSHMFPAQVAQAAVDVRARMSIPVHWAKYAESEHSWNESIQLFSKAADSLKIPFIVPFIGQPYTIGDVIAQPDWWNYF